MHTLRAICLWSLTTLAISAELRTMTVDINKLYNAYHVTQQTKKALQAEQQAQDKVKQHQKKTTAELNQKIKDLMTKLRSKTGSNTEKNKLTKEYDALVRQYNTLHQDTNKPDRNPGSDKTTELQKQYLIARRQGLAKITSVVKKFAQDNGYHWVMETSGATSTQISPLIYAKNTEDKTNDILAILNKDSPQQK